MSNLLIIMLGAILSVAGLVAGFVDGNWIAGLILLVMGIVAIFAFIKAS